MNIRVLVAYIAAVAFAILSSVFFNFWLGEKGKREKIEGQLPSQVVDCRACVKLGVYGSYEDVMGTYEKCVSELWPKKEIQRKCWWNSKL